ncbi:MAG TPA: DnaB-like helicase C-terminal domain-containing protein [Candidatus Nanoarchaeia archaeon]|nr:DnaB-like helicase C-terminal domain-containing protein [Candidatus Nanoarchaeia archaeon]
MKKRTNVLSITGINALLEEAAEEEKGFSPEEDDLDFLNSRDFQDSLVRGEDEQFRRELGIHEGVPLPLYGELVKEVFVALGKHQREREERLQLGREQRELERKLSFSQMEVKRLQDAVGGSSYTLLGERIPPQDVEVERAILGLLIRNPNLMEGFNQKYLNLMFYMTAHRKVHGAMIDLGIRLDVITLDRRLGNLGLLDEVGGAYAIHQLAEEGRELNPNVLPEYIGLIEEDFIARELILKATEVIKKLYAREKGAHSSMTEFVRAELVSLFDVLPFRYRLRQDVAGDVDEVMQSFDALIARGGRPEISTGYTSLDRIVRVMPGKLHVCGADTGMGKTTFMTNLMRNVAEQGYRTLMFTFESSRKEVLEKLIAQHAGVDIETFEIFDTLSEGDKEAIMKAAERVKNYPIVIESGGVPDIDYIAQRIRHMKTQHPDLALVVVDGLQSFKGYKPFEGPKTAIYAEVIKRLKDESHESRVSTLLTSQIATGVVYRRNNKRPYSIGDFADCKDLAKVADTAFFLYRPGEYWPDNDDFRGWLEVIPCKLRIGDKRDKAFKLQCDMATARITES